MTGTELISAVSAALLIAGAAGVAWAIFTTSAQKQATESWRAEAEAQEKRGDRLEQDISRMKADMAVTTHRLEAVELDNLQLRELVTGKAQVEKLTTLVTDNHAKEMARLLGISETLSKIVEAGKP